MITALAIHSALDPLSRSMLALTSYSAARVLRSGAGCDDADGCAGTSEGILEGLAKLP